MRPKKVLIVATVLKKHIVQFHLPTIKMLRENGFQVDVASRNDYDREADVSFCDNYFDLPFERTPFKKDNVVAYKKLKNIIDSGNYDIVHCHTPMGGFITRFAAQNARKNGTKVFYTAHGFHFYKGSPIRNWLLYYPAELLASFFTDVLITINQEDYDFAKRKMKAGKVEYIPGIGIDLGKFKPVEKIPHYNFNILSVGELIKRKNHIAVIAAVKKLRNPRITYEIAGDGLLKYKLEKAGCNLLGYRTDLPEIYKTVNLFILPSYQEGLPVALMEAMAMGVPCIASDIRGCRELLPADNLFNPKDENEIVRKIEEQMSNDSSQQIQENLTRIEKFSSDIVLQKLRNIYFRET